MKRSQRASTVLLTLATLAASFLSGATAQARNRAYQVIYKFQGGTDGWNPVGVPAVAKNGDLYGVTAGGGTYNIGIFCRLTAPRARGGAWKKTTLYNFPSNEGGDLVIFGPDGNLYGMAGQSIFELKAPTSGDGAWKYVRLYMLNGNSDGSAIQGITFGAEGNLYGATELGGDLGCGHGGCGTVFELKRLAQKGGKWRLSVLYTFDGSGNHGAEPFAGVTFDQEGNLYGTTNYGGAFGYGVAYRLTPPVRKGRPWTETVLYSFDRGNNIGSSPEGPVTFDGSGNVYGTTAFGGDLNCAGGFGCGVVYELSPPTEKGGDWTYGTLYAFTGGNDGANGGFGGSALLFDSEGNLYGTTTGGYTFAGTAFRLSPPANGGGAWTETTLHGFTGKNGDGGVPTGLTWGKWGDLYGVTFEGGTGCQRLGCGTVFEVRP
jgi:hypothetical protein